MKLFSERVVLGGASEELRISPALLEIAGGSIAAVTEGSRSEFQGMEGWEDVQDLGADIVSPSFVNSHTHLCMVGFRGIGGLASLKGNVVEELYFKIEEQMSMEDILSFARIGAVEALLNGVGFCWDHYYAPQCIVKALVEVGLGGAVAATLQDVLGPGLGRLEEYWDFTFALDEDQELRRAGIVAALGPHATDTVSDALWGRIREASTHWGLPFHTHIAQSIYEVQRSHEQHGCNPMTRMQRLGLTSVNAPRLWVHALYVTDSELDGLDPERDHLGHCPAAQMQFAFPANVQSWRDRGMKVVLGTDAGSCNDGVNIQSELKLFAAADAYSITMGDELLQFRSGGGLEQAEAVKSARQRLYASRSEHIQPERLLRSVWGDTASLHPKAPVGAIEAGRWANICQWDPEHPSLWPCTEPFQAFAFCNAAPSLKRIMVRGDWKYDGDGYLAERVRRSPKMAEWTREATERHRELRARTLL
jgi:5-methylthioadenosine/S-adenosylhomocysteine deaminase